MSSVAKLSERARELQNDVHLKIWDAVTCKQNVILLFEFILIHIVWFEIYMIICI